jgi:hypothetical protein
MICSCLRADSAAGISAAGMSPKQTTKDGAFMEPRVATGGNPLQIAHARESRNQAKTLAVGCDQLPRRAHGKEGSTVRVRQRACIKCL